MRTAVVLRWIPVVIVWVSMGWAVAAQTEARLQGTVRQLLPQRGVGDRYGMHLLVRTRKGLIEVCLGPARFLEAHQLVPRVGDRVLVKGHPITSPNGQLFLASSFVTAGRTLTLRNSAGKPRWRGCGHDCGRLGNCGAEHGGHDEQEGQH